MLKLFAALSSTFKRFT